jgi:GntR family transcriptional regulator, transcriptional repressor for pyruvate dehydrogenase complex
MPASTKHSGFRRSHGVARALEAEVRDGRLRTGDRLPTEQELCLRFGASRTVIREALQSLKGRGVVVSRRGSGNYVGDVAGGGQLRESLGLHSAVSAGDARAYLELLDLRLLVESACAAKAARERTPAALEALRRRLAAMTAARRDLAKFGEADIAFHQAVVAAAGHDLFANIMEALLPHLGISFAHQTYISFALVDKNLRDHRAIFQAIAKSDAAAAQRHMHRHLKESRAHFIALGLDQPASGPASAPPPDAQQKGRP